jgi:regulator of cell morphogenesis and NO signaling
MKVVKMNLLKSKNMKPSFDITLAKLSPSNNIIYKDRTLETLGQIAVADFRNALVLKKYELDYSFGGKHTLKEACEENGLSIAEVEYDLNAVNLQPRMYNLNYNEWAPDYLADFILANHHQYVRRFLLLLTEEFDNVSIKTQLDFPFISLVGEVFQRVATDMSAYMIEEEQVIFPYIRFLVQAKKSNLPSSLLPAGCMEHRMAMMEIEQKILGDNVEFIRKLCNNYTLPEGNSSSCMLLYQWLNDFDNDLQQHVHLENNILFPKAVKLEQDCLQRFSRSPNADLKIQFQKNPVETLL